MGVISKFNDVITSRKFIDGFFKYLGYVGLILLILFFIIPLQIFTDIKSETNLDVHSFWNKNSDLYFGSIQIFIGILNIAILIYISKLVHREGVAENKKLLVYEKKVEAYEILHDHYSNASIAAQGYLIISRDRLNKVLANEDHEKRIESYNLYTVNVDKEILEALKIMFKYQILLTGFALRYGHFFKYNFESNKFKKLVNTADAFYNCYDAIHYGQTIPNSAKEVDAAQEKFKIHNDLVFEFFALLKNELIEN